MNLDDDELRATRNLNGVDKMSEEEIKDILERVILVNNFESFSSEGIIIEALQGLLDGFEELLDTNDNHIPHID